MHIHLDTIGGIAGDMFVASVLDAFPEFTFELLELLGALKSTDSDLLRNTTAFVESHNDGVFEGSRFCVRQTLYSGDSEDDVRKDYQTKYSENKMSESAHTFPHTHFHSDSHSLAHSNNGHSHVGYFEISQFIERSQLHEEVKKISLDIFKILGAAESRVHGKPLAEIAFHEVGAWDSITDIISASYLIYCLRAKYQVNRWTVSALPIGKGIINTEHGVLPIPAPAVSILLEGFTTRFDDVEGERVTPTGAAIVRYLSAEHLSVESESEGHTDTRLNRSGIGFGARKFPTFSNVCRLLYFEAGLQKSSDEKFLPLGNKQGMQVEKVFQVSFELDDQTGEDIAIALDRLRKLGGVLDVSQQAAFGKKGRVCHSVNVLVEVDSLDQTLDACFYETSTLGVRVLPVHRYILQRHMTVQKDHEQSYRVKIAERPNRNKSVKVDIDDLQDSKSGYAERQKKRNEIEGASLEAVASR